MVYAFFFAAFVAVAGAVYASALPMRINVRPSWSLTSATEPANKSVPLAAVVFKILTFILFTWLNYYLVKNGRVLPRPRV